MNRTLQPEATPERMEAIFRACGLRLTPVQLGQLWAYHGRLREGNADLNLTRVRNFEQMVLKLYVDSVLPAGLIELPSPLMDLGSGPGMPGIPLKIYRPEIEVVLAEQRGPRVEFLRDAVQREFRDNYRQIREMQQHNAGGVSNFRPSRAQISAARGQLQACSKVMCEKQPSSPAIS